MKKIITRQFFFNILAAAIITSAVLAIVSPVSCRLTDEGIEIFPGDSQSPEIEKFSVISNKSVEILCSEKIIFDNIKVVSGNSIILDEQSDCNQCELYAVADCINYDEQGLCAEILFSESTIIGEPYTISGIVYDTSGNSLEFSRTFYGYNENPAKLIFSEIRSKNSTAKVEFIEFYVLKSGNLSGLEVSSAVKGEENAYIFPVIDVKKGEFITLHGHIIEKLASGAKNELGSDLTLSTAAESCSLARDLWNNSESAFFGNNDVLVLKDFNTGSFKDAVLMCPSSSSKWYRTQEKVYADEAYECGIWTSGADVANAVDTETANALGRSVSRQNISELAARYPDEETVPEIIPAAKEDYLVVSVVTPGTENSNNEYVK
ncbi:hypothetical protein [Treponema sp.]|uniref:hypothetical protein n=1 Tax=Treponema sp. TaxID=166 RepID=UPI00388EE3B7